MKYGTSTLPLNERLTRSIFSDDDIVEQKKEKDQESDLERRDTLESNHHSARRYPQYKVIKKLDQDNSFTGLWIVESTSNPLPKELSGSWTDVTEATKTIAQYLNNQKETETNV